MIGILISDATEMNQKDAAHFVGKSEADFSRETKSKLWEGTYYVPEGRKDKVFIAGKLKERQYSKVDEYQLMQQV